MSFEYLDVHLIIQFLISLNVEILLIMIQLNRRINTIFRNNFKSLSNYVFYKYSSKDIDNLTLEEKNKYLIQASNEDNLLLVKLLSNKGANINNDIKPKIKVPIYRDDRLITYPLQYRINVWNSNKNPALIAAASNNHHKIVKYLLINGNNVNKDKNDGKNSALLIASYNGHSESVKELLNGGADIHEWEDMSLAYSCKNNHLQTVKELLDKEANISNYSDRALHWSCKEGHTEIARLLLDKLPNIDNLDHMVLADTCHNGHIEIVKLLLDKGVNIRAENDLAINYASIDHHTNIIQLLLDRGNYPDSLRDHFLNENNP